MQLPNFPDWLNKLDGALSAKIGKECEGLDLDEPGAKQAINKWIETTRIAKKQSSADNLKFSLTNQVALEIKQTRQIESRSVETHTEPLKDKTITSDQGPLEELWEHQPIAAFQKTKDGWYRRCSGRVNTCNACFGEGTIRCSLCNGDGVIAQECHSCSGTGNREGQCSVCHGSRFVKESGYLIGASRGTGLGGGVQESKVYCPNCKGKGREILGVCPNCHGTGIEKKQCTNCKGAGKVICQKCQGQGQLLTYETIQAKSILDENSHIVSEIQSLKNSWISDAKEIFSSSYQVEENLDLGEQKTARSLADDERVFFEKYDIRAVPVAIATIVNADAKHNTLFFIGKDRQVRGSALKAFKDIKRIILFRWVPATVLAIALVYFVINIAHHVPTPTSQPTSKDPIVSPMPDSSSDSASHKASGTKHRKSHHMDSSIRQKIH